MNSHASRIGGWVRRYRIASAPITILGIVAFIAGCSASGEVAEPIQESTPISFNYEPTANAVVFKIAEEQGFFDAQGLDVTLTNNGVGSQVIPLLINGQVDVVPTGFTAGLAAITNDIPIQAAAGTNVEYVDPVLGPTYGTVAGPGTNITSWKDLEGKTVGIHSAAFGWAEFTKDAVKSAGGDPSKVSFAVVPFTNQVQALRDHQVDAITTLQPYVTLAKLNGGTVLGHTQITALGIDDPIGQVAWMAQSFVAEHPDVPEKLRAALQDAADWAAERPEETRALIVAETGADPSLVAAQPLPRWISSITGEQTEAVMDFMVRWGQISAPLANDKVFTPGALN